MTPPAHSGTEIAPAANSATSSAAQLAALLQTAGISPLDATGWIRVTGEDRTRWLNGMVTNSIQQLQPGEGNYNFFLSVQGRIQGDATIFAEPAALLLETASTQIPNLITLLDRFIIMDDVELADITAAQSGLSITGPEAASLLSQIGLPTESLAPLNRKASPWDAAEVTLIHAHSPLVPRFELWADPTTAAALAEKLLAAGATLCDPQSQSWLRILEGTPLYGTDIRNSDVARDLPQETAQTRALHFAKGCYLGQEIVERIRSRGNVHRTFTAFRLEGPLPAPGAILEAEGKPAGELTSTAAIPLPTGELAQLALGYIRREALDRNLPLRYPGGTALPTTLPSSPAEATTQRLASESSESSERV
jgi:folate-binding protein YgfZ